MKLAGSYQPMILPISAKPVGAWLMESGGSYKPQEHQISARPGFDSQRPYHSETCAGCGGEMAKVAGYYNGDDLWLCSRCQQGTVVRGKS